MRGIFSSSTPSLLLSPLSLSSGEEEEKKWLLEEQEKFVNFWSSYSLRAPLVGGLEEYIVLTLPRFGGG